MKQVEIQNLNQELMRAAAEGNLEAVQKLVLRGADIYFRDHQGDTAWLCCINQIWNILPLTSEY